jgi:hypothetical protein
MNSPWTGRINPFGLDDEADMETKETFAVAVTKEEEGANDDNERESEGLLILARCDFHTMTEMMMKFTPPTRKVFILASRRRKIPRATMLVPSRMTKTRRRKNSPTLSRNADSVEKFFALCTTFMWK